MPKRFNTDKIYRIIDANINRAKEGLRVCEEIARFILNNKEITAQLKSARHKIDNAAGALPKTIDLIRHRNIRADAGKNINTGELNRNNLSDIYFANMQRAKESIRALEEFSKLINTKAAVEFKKIRYFIYEIEKKAAKKVVPLCNFR